VIVTTMDIMGTEVGVSNPKKGLLSFFLSWVSKTQPNHRTKQMAST